MNIQDKINESKRRTQLMNGITIDWQYAQQIIPSVLPVIAKELGNSNINMQELQTLSETLYKLFTNIEENVKELRTLIPLEINN